MKINIVTLFPELFTEHLNNLPFKRAIDKGLMEYKLWNLRDFADDRRGTVDDKPFGGGAGMILLPKPIYKCLKEIHGDTFGIGRFDDYPNKRIILLSPKGKTYNQQVAKEFSELQEITLICGRYEGVDARVSDEMVTDIVSIGNYVLSGGELPAMVIMESITRLIPGVIENEEALNSESFNSDKLEYPQYTKPRNFMGLEVPEVLLNGNHAEIKKWQNENSEEI